MGALLVILLVLNVQEPIKINAQGVIHPALLLMENV